MKEILSPKQKQWILGGFVGVLVIAVIVIILLIVFGAIWKKTPMVANEALDEDIENTIIEEESCEELPEKLSQTTTLNYILDHINSIAPYKPKPGNRWVTQRLEFASNNQAYAIFSDSESEKKVLVEITKSCGESRHQVLAYFERQGDEWNLKEGDDIFHETSEDQLQIYEFYDPKKEWLMIETIRQLEETQNQQEERIDENEQELTD